MKKLMMIGLAAASLLTLAGQAKATALETSGELRARSWLVQNYVIDKKDTEWFDQRLRLNMVWPVAEGVKVNVRADILEGFWGDNISAFTTTVTTDAEGKSTATSTTSGFSVRPAVNFDHVNMQFTWPGTPVTFQVGRQDVSFGTGFLAKADNRDRFKVSAKFAPELTLGFAYDKSKEVFGAHDSADGTDDARGFTLSAAGTVADWNYGGLVSYTVNETTPTVAPGVQKRTWADGFVTGKAGPLDLKVEVAFVTGDNKVNGKSKVDVGGLGAYVSVAVPAGPVTIAVEGAYAAGDDPTTAKNEGGFRADYNSSFWSIILYNNLDYPGYLGSATGNAVTSTDPGTDYGVTNAAAGKLSFTVSPVKGFTIIAAAVFAQALEDVKIGTTTHKADNLGTELDLVAVYSITENVYFLGGVGYLMAGDFFGDVDDPLGVMGSLNVKF